MKGANPAGARLAPCGSSYRFQIPGHTPLHTGHILSD